MIAVWPQAVITASRENPTGRATALDGHTVPEPERHAVSIAQIGDARVQSPAREMRRAIRLAAGAKLA